MFYLLYISTPTTHHLVQDYVDILEKAQPSNARADITGMLLACDAYFMQYLEGNQRALELLLEKIKNDSRHKNVFVLDDGHIEERLFPNWKMGFDHMNWSNKLELEHLSPVLRSPAWEWGQQFLSHRPIGMLDQFRRQFGVGKKRQEAFTANSSWQDNLKEIQSWANLS